MDLSKSETTVRKVKPNLHLKVSLGIIRYMGTWPPQNDKFYRLIYMIYTFMVLTFMLGIYLFVQSINVVLSWGNLSKIASGAPIFMTNAVHAYKVRKMIFQFYFYFYPLIFHSIFWVNKIDLLL